MIVHNLNENECESFREMLQKDDLLGGSKGNDVHEVFPSSLSTKK